MLVDFHHHDWDDLNRSELVCGAGAGAEPRHEVCGREGEGWTVSEPSKCLPKHEHMCNDANNTLLLSEARGGESYHHLKLCWSGAAFNVHVCADMLQQEARKGALAYYLTHLDGQRPHRWSGDSPSPSLKTAAGEVGQVGCCAWASSLPTPVPVLCRTTWQMSPVGRT